MKQFLQPLLETIEKAFNWIISTFDTHTKGASARKITAFWVMLVLVTTSRGVWLVWAWKHDNFDLLEVLTDADYLLVAGLLGLTTYQALKEKKQTNEEQS